MDFEGRHPAADLFFEPLDLFLLGRGPQTSISPSTQQRHPGMGQLRPLPSRDHGRSVGLDLVSRNEKTETGMGEHVEMT